MRIILCVCGLWVFGNSAAAAPFLPQDDEQVLQRLPSPAIERQLRQRTMARDPADLQQAVELAWTWLRLGRAQADPRYYGYAEAVLEAWWSDAEHWPEILLLRATLRQNRHDFKGALADLALVLKQQPRNAQAWLTRSVILSVLGEPQAAFSSCQPLLRLSSALLAASCLGNALSLSGQNERAYQLLEQTWSAHPESDVAEQLWALTLLAEIALRQDQVVLAEQHFQAALSLPERDSYWLGMYADFLLDQERFEEVQALLDSDTRIDALLLRLALAEQQLNPARGALLAKQFEARLDALRQRGEISHLGDSARFLLELRQQPEQALHLAQANWVQQRDPTAARWLLASAIAADNPQAGAPVLHWLQRTGLRDARLQTLVQQLQDMTG